jgi:uncharacterized membrane protein YdbT with pleckstrin-like domain
LTGLWLLAILLYGATLAGMFALPTMFPMEENSIIWFAVAGVVFFANFLATCFGWKGWKKRRFLNFLRVLAFFALLIADAGLFVLPMFTDLAASSPMLPNVFMGLAIFALAAYLIPWLGETIMHNHKESVITNKRLIMKKGVFSVTCFDAPLDKIIDIYVEIKFWGRIFNVHKVFVQTEQTRFELPDVRNAYDFKNSLMAQIEEQQESRFARQARWTAQANSQNSNSL